VSHLYRIKCLGFIGVVVWMPFHFTDFKKQHLIVSPEVFCFEVYIYVLLIDHLFVSPFPCLLITGTYVIEVNTGIELRLFPIYIEVLVRCKDIMSSHLMFQIGHCIDIL